MSLAGQEWHLPIQYGIRLLEASTHIRLLKRVWLSHRGSRYTRHSSTYLNWKKGTWYLRLKVLKSTSVLDVDTLSYHAKRVEISSQHRTSNGTGKIRNYIERVALKLSRQHFSGEHPMMVIDSLTRFIEEANIWKMTEVQAFIAFPSFFKRFAKSKHEKRVLLDSFEKERVSSWPEAVKYLLRTSAVKDKLSNSPTSNLCPKDPWNLNDSWKQNSTRLCWAVATLSIYNG